MPQYPPSTTTTDGDKHAERMPQAIATPVPETTPQATSLETRVAAIARLDASPDAIARGLREQGIPVSAELIVALNKTIGNSASLRVFTALDEARPETPKAKEDAPVTSEPGPLVEQGGPEPKASPELAKALVSVEPSTIPTSPTKEQTVGTPSGGSDGGPVLAPAPAVVFEEVGATLSTLGFTASARRMPVKAHTAPKLNSTGFSFTSSTVGDDGKGTSSTSVQTSYGEGMGKIHATGALAGSDDVTLNPAGDFTTLIHETVHLYQKGEVGRYLVEPMTEIIAAMAFVRLADKGIVKGSYNYAPEYLPWVVFVSEVIAPKIGWPRLFGYYVGQGFKNFDELAAELGFRPAAAPMKALKEAFGTGDVAKAEAQRAKIISGAASNETKRGFDKVGAELDAPTTGDTHDMSSFEQWLPTFGSVIEKQKKSGESNAQTASRLALENKREVIVGALAEARQHLTTADPSLRTEIEEFIAAYEEGLTMLG